MVIAHQTKSHFETLSAVLAGKAELRKVIDEALERRRLHRATTILFVKQVVETLISIERLSKFVTFFDKKAQKSLW